MVPLPLKTPQEMGTETFLHFFPFISASQPSYCAFIPPPSPLFPLLGTNYSSARALAAPGVIPPRGGDGEGLSLPSPRR